MALEQAGVQFIAAGGDVYISTVNNATKATNTFVDATEKGGGRVSSAGQVMIGALREVGVVAVKAFGQALKATAAFVGDSINLAGDFEANMLQFQSVAGKEVDTKGLEQFRDLFLDIGKRLPVSTSEVQQAAIEMVKGGIDPATIAAGGLEQNIQFAAAAMGGDLVKAAEISSKILGGWAGVNATAAERTDFLTHATDMLTKAANASSTDVEGLSRGIFQSQGIAKAAGVSFDDLVTTLAELAPRFGSSAEAGTSLKNMIVRLQPTTTPAIAAMEELGLYTQETGSAFYDAQGNFVGFSQASQLLQDALKNSTKEQAAAALQTIFGNDAMSSAAALAELGAAGYDSMAAALENANGVAAAAELKQQGFNTALDNAKGSVEALQITIGSALLPILTDLMNNVVAPAVNTLTDMASALFGNQKAFDKLSPAMQDVVTVIGSLISDVQDIVGAFDDAGAMSSEFGESIGKLASDLGLPGELIEDIIFAVQDMVAWFSTAGDESSDLGGALNQLNGVWELALKVVQDVGDGYMAVAQAVLPIVTAFWTKHGAEIMTFVQKTYDTLIKIITTALELYDAIVPPILKAIAGFISAHGSEIQKVLSGAWTIISSLITGTLETIKGVIKLALDLIHGDWDAAWKDIQAILSAQVTAITGIVSGFFDLIAGLFDTSMAEIGQTWADNWAMLVDIVTQTDWAAVGESVVSGIIQGLRDNWNSLTGWISDKISGLVDSALAAIGAGSPAVEWMPVGEFSVQGIMAGFTDMWPQLTSLVAGLGDDLVNQAARIAGDVQSAIADAFGATANIDRQKVANIKAVAGLDTGRQFGAQAMLNDAERQSRAMNDPQQAAEFFKMRSRQIIEIGELQDKINATTDRAERDRLLAQQDLINAAQGAEVNAFNAQIAQGSTTQSIADAISKLLSNAALPGLLDSSVIAQIAGLLNQLSGAAHRAVGGPVGAGKPYWVGESGPELFLPAHSGTIMPPATAAQLMGGSSSTTNNQQTSYNMPIYTNQSPAVLQQSMAILQASMT